MKSALLNIAIAAGLAIVGAFLPSTHWRWFVWSAASGLLLMLMVVGISWLKRRGHEVTPEETRKKVAARSKSLKILTPLAVGAGFAFAIIFNLFLPARFGWILCGAASGIVLFVAILMGPALLAGRPKYHERKFPLEPER